MPNEPAWRRVLEDLAANIDSGKYAPSSQLPSLPQLCELYEVSTSTVQKALIVLEDRGMVESRQGKGFFVVGPNPHRTSGSS